MRIADELQVDCPVFYIDNVAEYYQMHRPQLHELPRVVPPFKHCWVEFRWPTDSYHNGALLHLKVGVRLRMVDIKPADLEILRSGGFKGPTDRVKFAVWFQVHQQAIGYEPIVASKEGVMWIDESGAEIGVQYRMTPQEAGCLRPVVLAFAFMHCKNVRHVENEPTGQRTRRRQGKPPLVKFYTLEIDPMKETLRREGNVETVGLAMALHICRGHFKDYRASGLFGKIKGIFWWGPALRGTPEAGAVVKDYAVKAPDAPKVVH